MCLRTSPPCLNQLKSLTKNDGVVPSIGAAIAVIIIKTVAHVKPKHTDHGHEKTNTKSSGTLQARGPDLGILNGSVMEAEFQTLPASANINP